MNLARLANSGSLYEQLIAQTIAIESQPRIELRAKQTEQTVLKGVLGDFSSRVSALDKALGKLADPFQSPFRAVGATVPEGTGFTATATDGTAPARHEVQVTQLARADARLSKQLASDGRSLVADVFTEPGALGDLFTPPTPDRVVARSFTVRLAQPDGSTADVAVSYRPPDNATDEDVLVGLAAAINSAARDADLAEGTGVSASVVRETDGTARLSVRSAATGFGNRLRFDDPDGVLGALEVTNTAVRSGTGGGAVRAVGTGPEDSGLSAALTIDGLSVYRDTNTVDDALDGVTLTLDAVSDAPAMLALGADSGAMRKEVDAFVKAYNDLVGFVRRKSAVDPEAGTREVFAGDSGVRALRTGLRSDLASVEVEGLGRLADLGVETARDGTLSVADADALSAALARSPDAVSTLFERLAERVTPRLDGLLGSDGSIEARKSAADARADRLGDQIARLDGRLAAREDALRAQFALLEEFALQAQGQQASIQSLFFF